MGPGFSLDEARDTLQDRLTPRQYIVVPVAQYSPPHLLQVLRASGIHGFTVGMLPAIHLDHQSVFDASEVGHECTDRMLPAKAGAMDLAATERTPEM